MRIRRLGLVAGLVGLGLAGAPGVGALEAAPGPTTTGPLVRRSASCDEDSEGAAPLPGRIWEDARIGAGRVEVSWGPGHYNYRWRRR